MANIAATIAEKVALNSPAATSPLDLYQLVRQHMPDQLKDTNQVLEQLGQHLQFRGYLGFEHPSGEIARIDASRKPVQVFLNRFTVAGLLSPLPEPYFQWCYDRMRSGDQAMASFFDLFNHRINSLRYVSRARREPGLAPLAPEHSVPGQLMSAFAGGPDTRQEVFENSPITGRALLGLAGLLIYGPRSLSLIQLILQRLLNWTVKVEGFVGGWLGVDEDQRIALGLRNSTLSADTRMAAQLGSRVWDQHLGLRMVVTLDDPRECFPFLPGQKRHDWLCQLMRMLTYFRYDIELKFQFPRSWRSLKLKKEPVMLGYTSWLTTRPSRTPPNWQLTLHIPAQKEAHYEAF